MKGMCAILGCSFAAYAAPLFANEVPLVLEETIQLPTATPYWDVMVGEDGTLSWAVCKVLPDGRQVILSSCSTDSVVYNDFVPFNELETYHVFLYSRAGIGPMIGFAQQSFWSEEGLTISEFPCHNPTDTLFYNCHLPGGLCRLGPPGLRINCYPVVSHFGLDTLSSEFDQRPKWYIDNYQCGSYQGISNCGNKPAVSSTSDNWDCVRQYYYQYRVECDYRDLQGSLFGFSWHVTQTNGSNHTERDGVALGRIYDDSVVVSLSRDGEAASEACTFDRIYNGGVLVAAFQYGTSAWHENFLPDVMWNSGTRYQQLFTVEVAWGDNEELLALRNDDRVFDIIVVLNGQIWGQTSPLDSGFAEMKIIGRYHNETRRLVVRYGSELRIYRFGDPIYTDADDARPELPQELTLSAYPNPFNPTTMIAFDLPKAACASLIVYDLTGRQVQTLFDEQMSAGHHEIGFDGASLPSGIYFARLSAGKFVRIQKLVLLK